MPAATEDQVKRGRGRPLKHGEQRTFSTFKLPESVAEALARLAAERGVGKTDVLVDLISREADLKRSA